MKKVLATLIFTAAVLTLSAAPATPKYKDPARKTDERVEDLLGRMTLQEKLGQLSQTLLASPADAMAGVKDGSTGSFCCVKSHLPSVADRNALQRAAVEQSRLGIPLYFGFDVIHGFKTLFPTPLGMAASWDPGLVKQAAVAAAAEGASWGMDIAFSPMVDVSRDARWGRISECFGEDVLMNRRFGRACVEGYQGTDLKNKLSMGSCVKHFVGYGAALGGRDYQFTELSERALRETYLPSFHECIEAGAVSVMSAFNDISGSPASANPFTLTKVLRGEWGFRGFVLSDWDAVYELEMHGIAGDDAQAAVAALSAGVDIEMKTKTYISTLEKSLAEKKIDIKTIDEAVRRVLRVKFDLGLFDDPYTDESLQKTQIKTDEKKALSRKAAGECMVLLKNNGVLPLKGKERNIAVIGNWANCLDIFGWWTGAVDERDGVTVMQGIAAAAPKGTQVINGSMGRMMKPEVAVVCVGESGSMFGEDHNRSDITLPWGQAEMIRQIKERGSKVVAVVFNGRPLALEEIMPYVDALVIAWHPGSESGNALADVLYGKVNPSGKLPVTFPRSTGQVPLFYCDRPSGRPDKDTYIDMDAKPLFPFGFGLSYTTFDYSDLTVAGNVDAKSEATVSVTVTNTGKAAGKEVVQLYIHDKVASVTQPDKKLIDFTKIELAPGASQVVTFKVTARQLEILGRDLKPVLEPGEFDVWAGGSSESGLHALLTAK